MADYAMRDIPDEFFADVKQRARGDGITLKALILALLRAYLAGEITVSATAPTITTRGTR